METITITNATVKRSGPRMTIEGDVNEKTVKVGVDQIDFRGEAVPAGLAAVATNKKTGQVYHLT